VLVFLDQLLLETLPVRIVVVWNYLIELKSGLRNSRSTRVTNDLKIMVLMYLKHDLNQKNNLAQEYYKK